MDKPQKDSPVDHKKTDPGKKKVSKLKTLETMQQPNASLFDFTAAKWWYHFVMSENVTGFTDWQSSPGSTI